MPRCTTTSDGRILRFNHMFAEMFDMKPSAMKKTLQSHDRFYEFIHPMHAQQLQQLIGHMVSSGQSHVSLGEARTVTTAKSRQWSFALESWSVHLSSDRIAPAVPKTEPKAEDSEGHDETMGGDGAAAVASAAGMTLVEHAFIVSNSVAVNE